VRAGRHGRRLGQLLDGHGLAFAAVIDAQGLASGDLADPRPPAGGIPALGTLAPRAQRGFLGGFVGIRA
jgi:hypothetical protein